MKEHYAAVSLAFLLALTLAGAELSLLTKANPIGMFPAEPEPLVVTLLRPKNGSRCFQDSLSIAFSLQNPTLGGANSITYMIDSQPKGSVNGLITAKEGERFVGFFDLINYSATLDLSGLVDGWHTLTVAASGTSPYNPEGGMGAIYADVQGSDSIRFLYDVGAPTVVVLIQQNQTYVDNDVPLNFILSETADWIGYSLDEQPLVTVTGNTTLVGLSEGMHSVTVCANDTVGRKGSSEIVFFRIEQQTSEAADDLPEAELFPTAVAVTVSGASLAIAAAGALVYWKRCKR